MKLSFKPFQPDIEQLYKVLRREKADRPVLFEFIVNLETCLAVSGRPKQPQPGTVDYYRMIMEAFSRLGYDAAPVYTVGSGLLSFPKGEQDALASRSQNQGALITDRESFDHYPWPDAGGGNYELYRQLQPHLPDGMKLLGFSNGGILENATDIVGFEKLCEIYLTDPELTGEIFAHIGERLLKFYSIMAPMESVGACIVNDDWGFKTQTMFPPDMMDSYVFPYTRKIVEVIHASGKPAILHSCGNVKDIMDVIIDDLKLDGKHSFEDGIYPVEDAWDWWSGRIAIMGGIDVDFLVKKSPEEIYKRSLRLLEKTSGTGGYALGSGNSIPNYVPVENHMAVIRAAVDFGI
jgi:uroporphyrinogen decarboxylase